MRKRKEKKRVSNKERNLAGAKLFLDRIKQKRNGEDSREMKRGKRKFKVSGKEFKL